MIRHLPLIGLVILAGCAGPRTLEPGSRSTPAPGTADTTGKIVAVEELPVPDLTLDHVTLADSLATRDPDRLLADIRLRYDAALAALERSDTTAAHAAVDEVLGLLILLSDDQKHAATPAQADLLRQLGLLVDRIQDRRRAAAEVRGSIPRVINRRVTRQINLYLKDKSLDILKAAYQRSGRYTPMIREQLAALGLPIELQWLPIIESAFKPRAFSWAAAAGMWQFIYDTGKRYGLKRSGWVDDRFDPYKATPAALAYLGELYGMFDDWFLALAAYNCGEYRVLREINRTGNRDYWKMRLPRETRNYVPKFLAVLHILENPEKYGVDWPETHHPHLFEAVHIDKSVTLKDVADLLAMPQDDLKALNSDIRYGVTPPTGYSLRVPLGAGTTLIGSLDELPESDFKPPPEVRRYRVRRGDTLGHIARRFRTSVSRLRRMNRIRGSLIRIGQVLRVPGRNYNNRLWVDQAPSYGTPKDALSHTVRRGDTLIRIARYYGTSVTALKQNNGLRRDLIHPGQVLRLPATGKDGGRGIDGGPVTYNIRSGDTLSRIAQVFKVSVTALMRANPDIQARRLRIGQRIIIPG
ncbi:MAG: LysM peptidoglycan-binding domain-containing protein [Gemmatimonadetes bacterium]|nr:LysM peptidoglycan-binding domain-containing protein [Gemmatimonadota bacterium]